MDQLIGRISRKEERVIVDIVDDNIKSPGKMVTLKSKSDNLEAVTATIENIIKENPNQKMIVLSTHKDVIDNLIKEDPDKRKYWS